jgi:hypothetical protein
VDTSTGAAATSWRAVSSVPRRVSVHAARVTSSRLDKPRRDPKSASTLGLALKPTRESNGADDTRWLAHFLPSSSE